MALNLRDRRRRRLVLFEKAVDDAAQVGDPRHGHRAVLAEDDHRVHLAPPAAAAAAAAVHALQLHCANNNNMQISK